MGSQFVTSAWACAFVRRRVSVNYLQWHALAAFPCSCVRVAAFRVHSGALLRRPPLLCVAWLRSHAALRFE